MAEPLDITLPISNNGYATPYFENVWEEVRALTVAEPAMDVALKLFEGGYPTRYFEDLWNGAAQDLSKENLDTGVILVQNGFPTLELEEYWEDLIT